ncbi:MAG: AAA family ATPase, partial [Flavobacteriales bacterium]|nr:AAA family ATPase [Flavobacteriales bacterium]
MLTRLHIRNYAIISEVKIDFNNGLSIITGETGAGKSILIGALSLVLGKRADSSVLFNKDEKCIVEAHFNIAGYQLETFFEQNDLDMESVSIIRREINAQGKSRAFVNDTPVNLTQLRELTSKLIDIHSQHAVLTLKTADFRTGFIDSCADGGKQFSVYTKAFGSWLQLKTKTDELKEQLQRSTADEDYLKFQLAELEELNLQEGELQSNQQKLNTLENAEEIRGSLSEISELLSGSENAIVDALRNTEIALQRLVDKYPNATEWAKRVSESLIDLEDIAEDMQNRVGEVDENPAELLRLQERVDEIHRILTKHHKQSEAELIAFQAELDQKLNSISNSDEQLTLLNAELERSESKLNS